MDATAAARIAQETLNAFERGHYNNPGRQRIDLKPPLAESIAGTRQFLPDELARLREDALRRTPFVEDAAVTLTRETTLEGAARLLVSGVYQRIGVLNFASARKPGGGFLNGARAQEESLARGSALSISLNRCPDFYDYHRALETNLYSDRMIYSPRCPVIRNDAGDWLDAPLLVDFITSPAPNAGAVMRNEPDNRGLITPTLTERASKVIGLAASQGCDALVLGAWGCGVFQNDPATVARIFSDLISAGARFARHFRHIHFAVHDSSREQSVYSAFALRFTGV